MTKKSSLHNVSGPLRGLHRGKRITVYMLGGAERWAEDWRQRVYFYGWEGSPVDRLLYTEHRNGKVFKLNLSNAERIEEGWYGEGEDVRAAANYKDTQQVERFKAEAKEAPVMVTKITRQYREYSPAVLSDIIAGLDAEMTYEDIGKSLDISQGGIGRVKAALLLLRSGIGPKVTAAKTNAQYRGEIQALADKIRPLLKAETTSVPDTNPVREPKTVPDVPEQDILARARSKRQELLDQIAKIDAAVETLEGLL